MAFKCEQPEGSGCYSKVVFLCCAEKARYYLCCKTSLKLQQETFFFGEKLTFDYLSTGIRNKRAQVSKEHFSNFVIYFQKNGDAHKDAFRQREVAASIVFNVNTAVAAGSSWCYFSHCYFKPQRDLFSYVMKLYPVKSHLRHNLWLSYILQLLAVWKQHKWEIEKQRSKLKQQKRTSQDWGSRNFYFFKYVIDYFIYGSLRDS